MTMARRHHQRGALIGKAHLGLANPQSGPHRSRFRHEALARKDETPLMPSVTMLRRAGFVILGVMFTLAAVMAIAGRGPWYDEFYSFYLVRPGAPLGVLVPAWLRDNHPPLFYALAWVWARLLGLGGLGDSVEGLRTINLVVLAVTVALIARLARDDGWFRAVVWYYITALAGIFTVLDRIDQLRSYFLSLALTALVVPLLARWLRRDANPAGQSVALGILLALTFSVHLITTVIVAGLVAAVFGHLVVARRWHDALRLALIAGLALIPFAVMMAFQLSTIVANTQVFWIPPGLNAARWSVEMEVVNALTANPVLGLVALAGLGASIFGAMRHNTQSRETALLIITLGAGLVLALVVLVIAHLHRPLLITRYLVALDPVLAMMLALGAERVTRHLPVYVTAVIDLAILIAAGLAIHANLDKTLHQWSWHGTAGTIAAQVRNCPETMVYPDMSWNTEPLSMPPRENREVVPFSYDYVAHRYGFALAPAGSHTLSTRCPTLFWTEHVANMHPSANTVIRNLRASGYPVTSGRMVRTDIGWVLITPPMFSTPMP
jgi:hypothetical protein